MSQTRRKRKERGAADAIAAVQNALNLPEVVEALAGEALAAEREQEHAAAVHAEQEALIAATQESEARPDTAFQLKRVIESLLFASDRPLTVANIRQFVGSEVARKEIQEGLDALVEEYSERGIVLHDVAGGYQFRTHPASSEWIQKLIAGRPVRLSRAQLDTLAIIAYRQPITRPEIDDIRGVDSGSTLKVLLDRNMVRILGKKEEVGRPLLYGTSKEFLEFFNLAELRDLPTLREFHELNDEGMAEVDKLGADIRGVDVGAVAAQVAAEREAEAIAAQERAEAEAEEKRLAKEAAKAEKLAAEEPKFDPKAKLVMPDAHRPEQVEEAEAAESEPEPEPEPDPTDDDEPALEAVAVDAQAVSEDDPSVAEVSLDEEPEVEDDVDDWSMPADVEPEPEVLAEEAPQEDVPTPDFGDPVVQDEAMTAATHEGHDSPGEETKVDPTKVDPDTEMEHEGADQDVAVNLSEVHAAVEHTIPDQPLPESLDEDFGESGATLVDRPSMPDVTLVDRVAAPLDDDDGIEALDDLEDDPIEHTDVGGFEGEKTSISEDRSSTTLDEEPS